MTRILLALLAFYRRWLSPALHSLGTGGCKYLPTCSEYAAQAITAHGPVRGTGMAMWRLLRCHPFSRGGLDPVPAPRDRTQSETGQNPSSAAKNHAAAPAKQTPPFAHKPLP